MKIKTFEEFLNEILLFTSLPKKKDSPTKSKPKRDPYGEDPEVTARRLKQKQKQKQESYDFDQARAKDAYAKYLQLKKAKGQTPSGQMPLRKGEVRSYNKQTGRWESNLD